MKRITNPNKPLSLPRRGNLPAEVHVFDDRTVWALNAALAAGRPLLVRGEPGVGKTQLARAAAEVLGRPFLSIVVDARTESRDLLFQFDAVQRLAEAQVRGALGEPVEVLRSELAVERFLHPAELWWAFDWRDAKTQADLVGATVPEHPAKWKTGQGVVLLIDEIDKAESDVPNGLLEALGSGSFTPQGRKSPVTIQGDLPLVVITTNEERVLPDAFIRRCLVLPLEMPTEDDKLREFLIDRGRAHFDSVEDEVLTKAAGLLIEDRNAALAAQLTPLPGQAEYLDLLRAVTDLEPEDGEKQLETLEHIKSFVLDKNAGSPR